MDPEQTGTQDVGRRRAVLGELKGSAEPKSIAQLASALDVHPNTIRFHLDTLVEHGQVERVPGERRGPGRPALLFRAVPGMDPTGPRGYLILAEILTAHLAEGPDPAGEALAAGRAWGRRLVPPPASDEAAADPPAEEAGIDRLVGLLDRLGFAPERRADEAGDGAALGLRHCPFLELAEATTQVVCPIHLGLMQGALEAQDTDVRVDRLEAFVEPDLCLAHLSAAR